MPSNCSLAPAGVHMEWEAFLALMPILSDAPFSALIYEKLLRGTQRRQHECLTRHALLLEAGLTFFEHLIDVDLAIMQLAREHYLEPVPNQPFTFRTGKEQHESTSD